MSKINNKPNNSALDEGWIEDDEELNRKKFRVKKLIKKKLSFHKARRGRNDWPY